VTATDVLVLSPVEWPATPDELPGIFDAFLRAVAALEGGRIAFAWEDGVPLLAHPASPEPMFRPTPVLRDGWTTPFLVPSAWQGQISRAHVADYFVAEWQLFPREPSWGAHSSFEDVTPAGEGLRVRTVMLPKLPVVDPLRDTAAQDDESMWPVTPELAGDWRSLLTTWEHVDGLLASKTPGSAWLARRSTRAMVSSDRLWWEIRGWRDAGDGHRYSGMEWHPVSVMVYLGWPAYFIAAAGKTTSCPACAKVTIQGRQYCGTVDCNRARAGARQRTSRAASQERRRTAPV
jgi:hypothetical protein